MHLRPPFLMRWWRHKFYLNQRYCSLQARLLNLPDLIPDELSPLHVATHLSQRVRRYWLVLGLR